MKSELHLLALLPSLALAQPLTLADCLHKALERDPQSQSDSLSGVSAQLQEQTLKASWRPSVSASVSYNRLSELDVGGITLPPPINKTIEIAPQIPNQYATSLRVDQLVWDGNRSRHQQRAAQHDQAFWNAAQAKNRQDLQVRVANAYWNLGAAQAAAKAAHVAIARADSQARYTVTAFLQGTALEQDTLQARLRTRQLEIQVEQAQATREFALQTLCLAMGLPLSYDLTTDSLQLWLPVCKASLVRPELRQVQAQILSNQEAVLASQSSFWPQVTASAQADWANPNPRWVPNHEEFDATWRVGVLASWNLYRGGADELTRKRAELAVRQAKLRETLLTDALTQDLARRQTEFNLARRRREIAAANLPLARRDLQLAQIRAQAGTALRLEAIDRAAALSQAESDLAQTTAAQNSATLNLALSRGEQPWK